MRREVMLLKGRQGERERRVGRQWGEDRRFMFIAGWVSGVGWSGRGGGRSK